MTRTYIVQEAVTSAAAGDKLIAINNPANSGVTVTVKCIESKLITSVQEATMLVERYPALVTGGTAASFEPGDDEATPTFPRVLRRDAGAPAPSSAPYGGAFSLPVAARTYDEGFGVQSRSGDRACFEFEEGALVIEPGESFVLTLLEAESYDDVRVSVEFEENELPPRAYLSQVLPVAGAWQAGAWFAVPDEWTGIALHLAYTAANPSVLARPKVRAQWRRGSVEAIQPITGTVDVTAPPTALRLQYQLEDTITAVTQGTTVEHVFAYAVLAGFDEVQFEVAELGAVATPGTIVANIVGG